jgi:secreted trypsin-like serine protease
MTLLPANPAAAISGGTPVTVATDTTRAIGFLSAFSRLHRAETNCTATLIVPTWVLTNQHCLEFNPQGPLGWRKYNPGEVRVTFGRLTKSGTRPVDRSDVVDIIRMPGYDRATSYNDLAVLRIRSAPPGVTPLPVAGFVDWPAAQLTIAGFGGTDRLRTAPARQPEFIRDWGLVTRPARPYGLLQHGDSGGPLLNTADGRTVQVGGEYACGRPARYRQ